ncbi:hypothetical protein [Vagococcus penaei]|nr:hypothetical protein [Vagococcus penaei]
MDSMYEEGYIHLAKKQEDEYVQEKERGDVSYSLQVKDLPSN